MNFSYKTYQQTWEQINQRLVINYPINLDLQQPISLLVFDSLASTNPKVWQLLDQGDRLTISAIALEQTAGKGQWGNNWVSPRGGLYLSVGLNLDLEMDNYPHLVMATAWGIATVLRHYQLPVTIKWSNDLILNQRKLGGIKIETRNRNDKLVKAVVGVGINWHNCVPNPGINLQSYYANQDLNRINSLAELTAIASYGILFGYQYYLTVGINQLLAKYLEIFHSLGQKVEFNGSCGEVSGITTAGKLKVKLRSPGASTEIAFSPGQISLGYQSTEEKLELD